MGIRTRIVGLTRFIGASCIGAFCFCGQVALAHESPVHKEILYQHDNKGSAAIVRYGLTGPEVAALVRTYDLDRSGDLSGRESKVLARVLLRQAISGIDLKIAGLPLDWEFEEARVESLGRKANRIAVVGLCEWTREDTSVIGQQKVSLSIAQGTGMIHFQMQTLGDWSVADVSLGAVSKDSRGLQGRLSLRPGKVWEANLIQRMEK